jgi:hypothetical protein
METTKTFSAAWTRLVPGSALAFVWIAGCHSATGSDWSGQEVPNGSPAATSSSTTTTMQGGPSQGVASDAATGPSVHSTAEGGVTSTSTSPQDAAPLPTDSGFPPGASQIAGIEFLHRIVGTWSGINSNTPLGFNFPMTVEFSASDPNFVFGKYQLDANNDVCWGFNIETYGGQAGLTFRNGGYLGGVLRDSRLKLMDHDTAKGTYHFCAVLERGAPVDGCNYIDATYTFLAPDHLTFVVTTLSGKPHVNWDATRSQTVSLPDPFPASVASEGNGSAPWPAAAGIPGADR